MSQPKYKLVGRIGDQDPIAYGGGFVYVDETGVYAPRLDYFEPGPDEEWDKIGGKTPLKVYRLDLDPPRFKTFKKYIGADGREYQHHDRAKMDIPSERGNTWYWYPEWFVDGLDSVADSCGMTKFALLRELFSKDPVRRARGYEAIIGHHGPYEFDQDPLTMTEDEAYERYAEEMKQR